MAVVGDNRKIMIIYEFMSAQGKHLEGFYGADSIMTSWLKEFCKTETFSLGCSILNHC